MNDTPAKPSRWTGAWPDALAFAFGLALAWYFRWSTTDLVWSLWLSSLVVGYALIVWQVTTPMRELVGGIAHDRGETGMGAGAKTGALALFGVGTLFGLAFFSVHFGGFHFVHSKFLEFFFPLNGSRNFSGFADWSMYREVFVRYWWFLPAAFLAERAAFKRTQPDPDVSVTPEAIARRKLHGDAMMAPYRNVIRMHLLIFFFAFAHFAKLESFLVYAVVYAVYFFPWRLVRKNPVEVTAT